MEEEWKTKKYGLGLPPAQLVICILEEPERLYLIGSMPDIIMGLLFYVLKIPIK
jgi:hypothetical protein